MEMIVKDERKLVEIWLTNAEKADPVLRAGLQSVYDTYKKKKYLVAVFESGNCDLYAQTRDLLLYNRQRMAEQEIRREKAQHVFRGISARKGAFVKFFHKLIVLQQFSGSPLIGELSLPCPGRRKHSLCGSRFRVRRIQRICGHFREARHRCESLKCRSPNREV